MDVLAHFFKSYRSLCLAINVELNGWEKNYIQGYIFFRNQEIIQQRITLEDIKEGEEAKDSG